MRGVPLQDALDELQRQTGVRLRATPEVKDQRVTLFIRKRPLSVALSGLAKLLHHRWIREGHSESPRHTLLVDKSVRREEQERLGGALAVGVAPWLEAAARARVAAIAKVTSPARASVLARANPGVQLDYLLQTTQKVPAPGLQLIASLSPGQREQLLVNGIFYLPWQGMDPRQQVLTDLYFRELEIDSPAELQFLRQTGPLFYAEVEASDPRKVVLTVWLNGSFHSLGPGPAPRSKDEGDPRPVRVRPYRMPSGTPAPDYAAVERFALPKGLQLEAKRTYTWSELLAVLSQRLPFALFTDHFRASTDAKPIPGSLLAKLQRSNVAEMLDSLCREYRRVWWTEGNSIFLRDRDWYFRRLYEVPIELQQALETRLAEREALDPEGMVLLSRLTSRQLEGWSLALAMEAGDRVSHVGSFWARKAQPYLALAGALPLPQQLQALSSNGLLLEQMSPLHRADYLQTLLVTEGAQVMEAFPNIALRIEQTPPIAVIPGSLSAIHLRFSYAPETRMISGLWLPYRSRRPATGGDADAGAAKPAVPVTETPPK